MKSWLRCTLATWASKHHPQLRNIGFLFVAGIAFFHMVCPVRRLPAPHWLGWLYTPTAVSPPRHSGQRQALPSFSSSLAVSARGFLKDTGGFLSLAVMSDLRAFPAGIIECERNVPSPTRIFSGLMLCHVTQAVASVCHNPHGPRHQRSRMLQLCWCDLVFFVAYSVATASRFYCGSLGLFCNTVTRKEMLPVFKFANYHNIHLLHAGGVALRSQRRAARADGKRARGLAG